MSSIDKLETWIQSQYEYGADGVMDKYETKDNFLNIFGEGKFLIRNIASASSISPSMFYQPKDPVENKLQIRLAKLQKNLNKEFPGSFPGKNKKKYGAKDEATVNKEPLNHDQSTSKVGQMVRQQSELQKKLQEANAKNSKLEKKLLRLEGIVRKYEPTIKALSKMGVMTKPVSVED